MVSMPKLRQSGYHSLATNSRYSRSGKLRADIYLPARRNTFPAPLNHPSLPSLVVTCSLRTSLLTSMQRR